VSDETKSADESGAQTSNESETSRPADESRAAPGHHSNADTAAGPTAEEKAGRRAERRRSRKAAGAKVKQGADAIRNRIASVVWLIAVVCALFLAVGALLFALNQANPDNPVVAFILDGAGYLDGPSNPENGLFQFTGENAQTKNVLVNWGIAAVAYLIAGKILDRLIRP